MKIIIISTALLLAALAGCSYAVQGTPTYDATGIKQLSGFPAGQYKNLGLHSWGFYRPGFSDPRLSDVWEDLSDKVLSLGGNACIVRYEKIGSINARNIVVTCEVLKLD